MNFYEFDDFFDFRFGPFQMSGFSRPFKVGYSRTFDSHIIKLKLRKDIEKKDIKVRLKEDSVLEIEWPHSSKAEDIPID